ncbi:hypothetical protein C8R44DRAFT_738433 [Mycena epipterygia]|nr:hypothetical protein C8R44DRAFT_738433 [Mycena epipterygia]
MAVLGGYWGSAQRDVRAGPGRWRRGLQIGALWRYTAEPPPRTSPSSARARLLRRLRSRIIDGLPACAPSSSQMHTHQNVLAYLVLGGEREDGPGLVYVEEPDLTNEKRMDAEDKQDEDRRDAEGEWDGGRGRGVRAQRLPGARDACDAGKGGSAGGGGTADRCWMQTLGVGMQMLGADAADKLERTDDTERTDLDASSPMKAPTASTARTARSPGRRALLEGGERSEGNVTTQRSLLAPKKPSLTIKHQHQIPQSTPWDIFSRTRSARSGFVPAMRMRLEWRAALWDNSPPRWRNLEIESEQG